MASGPFTLANGDLRVEIDPEYGGRVTAFWSATRLGRIDWLVPTPARGRDPRSSLQAGMFPLAPFSNRIENAQFQFEGRDCHVVATQAGAPHAIHGHGLRVAWNVVERDGHGATLVMAHDGADWPAAYVVEQRFDLSPTGLAARMEVTNSGPGAMPVGLGWHPFLPVREGPWVTTTFETIWPPIRDSIPTGPEALPADLDFADGAPAPSGLDTGFGGWHRDALLSWRAIGAGLRITADEALGHVIVYTPVGQDYFCFEPVSHPINAINSAPLGRENRMAVIAAGQKFRASMSLRPELQAARRG